MTRTANPANRIQNTCQACGTEFSSYRSQPRKYCSRSCMGAAHAGREMPLKPRTGSYQECERCGEPFWVIKSEKARRRFCSKTCHDFAQTKSPVIMACAVCGTEMRLKPSQAVTASGARQYCSRDCYAAGKTKNPLGRFHNGKPAVQDSQGYVRVYEPSHPNAYKNGWISEHRLVVEATLGRLLAPGEHVHHLNHVRTDNRPENLALMTHSEHAKITGKENGDALRAAIQLRQQVAEYERRFGPLNAAGD